MPTKTELLKTHLESFPKKTPRIYTVSELTQDIKLILESSFDYVWVEGEVSDISKIATGTVFFTFKDERAQLKCVLFFNTALNLKFQIKNGMKLILFGHLGVYEPKGAYQLYVDKIEPKGIGSLQLALEQLKEKLQKDGLFDPAHKKPLPYLPYCIGIITSPSGAAIKDILNVLDRRFRDIEIIIYPVRVQGEGAKEDIVQAIKDFNRFGSVEVIILTRGGGSIEDLWAFNEEIVARAIYNSKIPIISAVGHERDVTIADLVADLRAPTPSVAAELVLPKREDLKLSIDDYLGRLNFNIKHILEITTSQLKSLYKKLELLNPLLKIPHYKQRIDDVYKQMEISMKNFVKLKTAQFQKMIEKLETLSPLSILSRGYSITFKLPGEEIIKDAKSLEKGNLIKTRVHKGEIISAVKEINQEGENG